MVRTDNKLKLNKCEPCNSIHLFFKCLQFCPWISRVSVYIRSAQAGMHAIEYKLYQCVTNLICADNSIFAILNTSPFPANRTCYACAPWTHTDPKAWIPVSTTKRVALKISDEYRPNLRGRKADDNCSCFHVGTTPSTTSDTINIKPII